MKKGKEVLIKAHNILQEIMEDLGEAGQDETEEFYDSMYAVENIRHILHAVFVDIDEVNNR